MVYNCETPLMNYPRLIQHSMRLTDEEPHVDALYRMFLLLFRAQCFSGFR